MPTIDLSRLRKYHADSVDANAALRRANEVMRNARIDLESARRRVEELDASPSFILESKGTRESKASDQARQARVAQSSIDLAARELAAAEQIYAATRVAQEEAGNRNTYAGRLTTRCLEYARTRIEIPADLLEGF